MTRRSALAGAHPAAHSAAETDDTRQDKPDEISREIVHETPREVPHQRPDAAARESFKAEAAVSAGTPVEAPAGLPNLEIDLDDPTGLIPSPTVLSVRASVMRRFETARGKGATSHTGLVLDALRATATRLVDLVTEARPGPQEGDLFPWRPTPGSGQSADRPMPLRVRPTIAELGVVDALVTYVDGEVRRRRPGSPKVTRSELVTVALDAFLPAPKRRQPK